VEDYYSILDLDLGASSESIKVAYRRLARERHPDRKIDSTDIERKAFSEQMAQLNGAYSVLSDPKLRHEYDEKLKIMNSLHASSAVSRVTETVTKSRSSHHVAPRSQVDSTLARELSKQLRINLLTRQKGLSWKDKTLEGFDWGLESSSWSSYYCVAGRGFGLLDPAAAKKFTNYSEIIVARCNRAIRKSHFLFLLPFQQLSEWESVSAEFNRFFSAERHSKLANMPGGIVLLDARQGRTMRFGSRLVGKQIEELLQCVSTAS
jgi:curved DNA-binding protein CbpA